MSDPENFLQRWSRRKLESEEDENASARPRESGDSVPQNETAEPAALDSRLRGNERDEDSAALDSPVRGRGEDSNDSKEPPFDITTLPSIESITAETDIRAFLQKGVPAQLTRAALRRAWSADPAIRDFIEIAENQWDFATGSDLPGFGSLDASADEVRQMVAKVFGEGLQGHEEESKAVAHQAEKPADSGLTDAAEGSGEQPPSQDVAALAQDQMPPDALAAQPADSIVQRGEVDIATQQNNKNGEYQKSPDRRPHGRALPQ